METETQDIDYKVSLSKFEYDIPLSEFNGELTNGTLKWMNKNKIKTLGELLKKGYKGCVRIMECREKRLEEIENLVKKYTKLEYDFYMKPVPLTSKEIKDILSGNYLSLNLSHLNLSEKVINFLDRKAIYTIKDVLELGASGVRIDKRSQQNAIKKIEEELTTFAYKLSQEEGDYFMRN